MTIHKLTIDHTAGAHAYLVAFRSDGKVFDYNSNTWVALSLPPVTPYVNATEITGEAGAGFSAFWVNADLGLLNSTATPIDIVLKWYDRLGGSPALATDDVIGSASVQVVSGEEVNATFLEAIFTPVYRAGEDTLYVTVQMRLNGQVITPDGAATCTIAIRQVNPLTGSNLFTVGPTTVDANGLFTLSKLHPTLNEDTSIYRAIITIVNLGVTYSFESHFPDYA